MLAGSFVKRVLCRKFCTCYLQTLQRPSSLFEAVNIMQSATYNPATAVASTGEIQGGICNYTVGFLVP